MLFVYYESVRWREVHVPLEFGTRFCQQFFYLSSSFPTNGVMTLAIQCLPFSLHIDRIAYLFWSSSSLDFTQRGHCSLYHVPFPLAP